METFWYRLTQVHLEYGHYNGARETETETDRQTHRQTDRHTHRQTGSEEQYWPDAFPLRPMTGVADSWKCIQTPSSENRPP